MRTHLKDRPRPLRRSDVLHPSDMCRETWCPRAAYYRVVAEPAPEQLSFKQLCTFENGHSAHRRFQRWLGSALEGWWDCPCGTYFYARGPVACPTCDGLDPRYDELPVCDPLRLIEGFTDGYLYQNQAVLEIKTVGLGTVRMSSPALLRAHTHLVEGRQVIDMARIWDSIRRPFAPHVRQGAIYAHCLRLKPEYRNIDKLVFLYEWKATNDLKEFVVRYNESLIRPLLDSAEEIAEAVAGRGPVPACRNGQELCPECVKLAVAA